MTRASICGAPSHIVRTRFGPSAAELEHQADIRDRAHSRYLALLALQEQVGWEQLSEQLVRS